MANVAAKQRTLEGTYLGQKRASEGGRWGGQMPYKAAVASSLALSLWQSVGPKEDCQWGQQERLSTEICQSMCGRGFRRFVIGALSVENVVFRCSVSGTCQCYFGSVSAVSVVLCQGQWYVRNAVSLQKLSYK